MSQENVEIVRQAFEAWNAGDMEGVGHAYDPDAVMRYPPDFPETGPFLGREAIVQQFNRLREALDYRDSLVILGEVLHARDRVGVRFAWRGVGHGPAMDLEATVVYTMRGGRIREAEFFQDYNEALEVTGLKELPGSA
jgi:ketosteroid isomerase-like protein